MVADRKHRLEITVEAAVDPPRARETCAETGQSIEEVVSDLITNILGRAGSPPDYMDLCTTFVPHGLLT